MTPASAVGTSPDTTSTSDDQAATAAAKGNDLLASLVTAMREVADHERETSLSGLRGLVDDAIDILRQRAAEGADELRRRAETDITGVGDWVKVETERIAAEGDRKIEGRRQQLTQQLTDHEQRSQREIESLHARVDEYERELASFFAQLNEIDDPAAFGTAAKRMPRPPALTAAMTSAAAAPVAPPPEATLPTTPAPAPAVAPDVQPDPQPDAAPQASATTEPVADAETLLVENHRTRMDALGLTRAETDETAAEAPVAADSEAAKPIPGEGENSLRARLAELDATLGPAEAEEPAASLPQERNGEVATAIVVHGLGSFGAITSFKQALEKVDGVHGISLALGPTGEFVYRATHDSGFDLVDAIEQIERDGAQIERQPDGSLRVTVQRTR